MATFRLSKLADADLSAISEYTFRMWGLDQALLYLDGLEACCRRLADRPGLGRACEYIRPDMRRFEHKKHVVFYRREAVGIFVSRILHESALPEKQYFD